MSTNLETQAPSNEGVREKLLAGVPVTERRLSLAGVSTSVLEGGAGPSLLLLHGPGAIRRDLAAGDPGADVDASRRRSRPSRPRRVDDDRRPSWTPAG